MAVPVPVRNPPPLGHAFEPNGHQIIAFYLAPKALYGVNTPGYVLEGVDVFAASPAALPFHPTSRRPHGEAWGYFYGAQATAGDARPAPGGCWARYGRVKGYVQAMEAVAFCRRFAFHVPLRGAHGGAEWVPTPWLMKEYRLNKGAAAFRAAHGRAVNMDCVVRKIFKKPEVVMAPPPPPPCGSDAEGSGCSGVDDGDDGYSGDEDRKRVGVGHATESPTGKRRRSG